MSEKRNKFKPFVHNWNTFTTWDWIQTIICSVTLLPIRVIIIVSCLSMVPVISLLSSLGDDATQAMSKYRRLFVSYSIRLLSRGVLFGLGFQWIKYKNPVPQHLIDKGITLVYNHVSFADMFLASCHFAPTFIAKEEMTHIPTLCAYLKMSRSILVRKSVPGGKSGTEQIMEAQRRARDGLPNICIYAEGTTSNGKQLIQFRSGAFVAGVPVLPCTMHYGNARRGNCGYESVPAPFYFLRLLTQWHNHVLVDFLPLYVPSEEEKRDARLYADNVCKTMASAMQLPIVNATLKDKLEFHSLIRDGTFSWKTSDCDL